MKNERGREKYEALKRSARLRLLNARTADHAESASWPHQISITRRSEEESERATLVREQQATSGSDVPSDCSNALQLRKSSELLEPLGQCNMNVTIIMKLCA